MTKEWFDDGASRPTLVVNGARTGGEAPFSILDGLSPPPRSSVRRTRWVGRTGVALGVLFVALLMAAFRLGMTYMATADEGMSSQAPARPAVGQDDFRKVTMGAETGGGGGTSEAPGAALIVEVGAACTSERAYDSERIAADRGTATIRELPASPAIESKLQLHAAAVSGAQVTEVAKNASGMKIAGPGGVPKRGVGKRARKRTADKAATVSAARGRDRDVDIIAAIVEATKPAR
ncbi:MAG: hypothetical protein RBT39_05215 [Azoarcus sp.]|jgi:hypothetical protein|nr:hypothetical protein [Azoarcus sp.]MDX9836942.1 hypothetical protein [Azoarcus sp.]